MSVKEYAGLVRHSEDYVRKHMLRGSAGERVTVRVLTKDLMDHIHDIQIAKEDDQ